MIAAIQNLLNTWAVSFDLPILEWIQANLQSGFLDTAMPLITLLGEDGIFWIVWSVLLMIFPKTRKTGVAMAFALAMGLLLCNFTLKPLIARPRPYDFQLANFGKEITLLIEAQHDFSFPSGHTIACFEAAAALLCSSKKMGIPALIIAVLVAFSRMYLYVHYPTDVLASIVLGTLLGLLGHWFATLLAPKLVKKGKFEK